VRTWPEAETVPVYLHGATGAVIWHEALEGVLNRTPQTPPRTILPLATGLKDLPRHGSDFYGAIGAAERLFGVMP
jgi:hypothetical protein